MEGMESANTEDYYLLSIRYCENKYDPEQKRKPEFKKIVSKLSDIRIQSELQEKYLEDGNGWFYIDNSKKSTIKFYRCEKIDEGRYTTCLQKYGDETDLMPHVFPKDGIPVQTEKTALASAEPEPEPRECPCPSLLFRIKIDCGNRAHNCQAEAFKEIFRPRAWRRLRIAVSLMDRKDVIGFRWVVKTDKGEVRPTKYFWCKQHVDLSDVLNRNLIPVKRDEMIKEECSDCESISKSHKLVPQYGEGKARGFINPGKSPSL